MVHDQDILYALDDEKLNKICMDIVTTKEFQDITNHKERLEAYVVFFKKQNSKKDIHQTKKKMLEIVKAGSNEKDIVMLLEEFHKKSRNIHTLKK